MADTPPAAAEVSPAATEAKPLARTLNEEPAEGSPKKMYGDHLKSTH